MRVGVAPGGWPPIRARLDVAADGEDQSLRGGSDLCDRGVERLGVPRGGLAEATDLANVLAGSGLDLTGGGWVVLMAECSDASAHAATVPAVRVARPHEPPFKGGARRTQL